MMFVKKLRKIALVAAGACVVLSFATGVAFADETPSTIDPTALQEGSSGVVHAKSGRGASAVDHGYYSWEYKDGWLNISPGGKCSDGKEDLNFDGNAGLFGRGVNTSSITKVALKGSWSKVEYVSVFSGLESLEIGADVASLGKLAALDLNSLSTIEFGQGSKLKTIGSGVFHNLKGLTSLDLSNCTNLESIEAEPNMNGPFGTQSIPNTKLTSVILPEGLKTLGYKAFSNCAALSSVQLPSSLEVIGKCAFEYCDALKKIEVPKSVKTIHANAFSNTASLKTLILYGGVTFGDLKDGETIDSVCQDYMGSSIDESTGYRTNSSETEIVIRDCSDDSNVSSTLKEYISKDSSSGANYVRKCITYPFATLGEYATVGLSLDNASDVASAIENALAGSELSTEAKAVLKQDTADKLAAAKALAAINALDTKAEADETALNEAKSAYNALSDAAKSLISNDVQEDVDKKIKAEEAKLNPPVTPPSGGGTGGSTGGSGGGGGSVAPTPSQHEHVWGTGVETVKATCTAAGTMTYHCTVSGCTETKTEAIPALGHKFGEWVVTTPATTQAAGVETRTCSVCGATETRAIDKIADGSGSGSGTVTPGGDKVTVGTTVKVSGITYKVTASGKVKVSAVSKSVKGKRTVTIPATVKVKGKTYKVTGISAKILKGAKATTLVIKSKTLTKKGVKNSLKGSKVKTVKIAVSGKKSVNKTYVSKYKKFFTKANCGKSVKLLAA